METEEAPFHVPNKYKVGDRVRVVRDVEQANAWYYNHSGWHKEALGKEMYVREADPVKGYCLSLKRNDQLITYWPSCALELVPQPEEASIDVPTEVPAAPAMTKPARVAKPRTKTTKTQPWDTAPCTHLRWHLMGLMKEKLKMTVTAITVDGVLAQVPRGATGNAMVTTCCVKCGTKMDMAVPVEGR